MSKALIPFYALYVGDGSAVAYTLDVSKDPFYLQNTLTGFNSSEAFPGDSAISPEFDRKLAPTNILGLQANNAGNNTDFGPVSFSIDQYQISFTLTTTPSNGTKFAVQGFIEY